MSNVTAKFINKNIERGIPQYDLKVIGETEETGTKVTFQAGSRNFYRNDCI